MVEETGKPTEAVPKWLQIRFGQLWEKYEAVPFSLLEATQTLHESKEVVVVILSRLRKSGWITMTFNDTDFRKKSYRLNNPANIFARINSEMIVNAQNQ